METALGNGMMHDAPMFGGDPDTRSLVRAYLLAKQRVIDSGFEREIAWQEEVSIDDVTPTGFVREAAWVVLCSGMRESVVRARFDRIAVSFGLWDPEHIALNGEHCRCLARAVFNNASKIDAIARIAVEVAEGGVDDIIRGMSNAGPAYLRRFPYIGRVTCFHLAKNLGYPVAKPDRHLERMAAALGFSGASSLCRVIAAALDEPVPVVDVVMWRFATIDQKYESWLKSAIVRTHQPCSSEA